MIAFQRKLQVDNGVSHTLSFINDDIETREMNLSSKCHRTELLIARKRLSDLVSNNILIPLRLEFLIFCFKTSQW
ncbi:hypothetical protein NC653_037795 [Populus alba x Populus x berolinensis]|uniref:Uncharacterized protein n=1 Tax=Populus alba x Populus x berolinensis TaxID=444605 RepID=A0AAD6LF20_9ROSI|nr:hypothetical protein NC653_037795 [Populus alba x Populus x berolinensis]